MKREYLIKILALVGLIVSIAYFIYYFQNMNSMEFRTMYVFLFLLLPMIILLLLAFSNIKKAVLILIIQNVIEVFLTRPFSSKILQIFFVLLPLFLFYKYLRDEIMIKNFVNKKNFIIIFIILSLVYLCLSAFSLWQIFKMEIIVDSYFQLYIIDVAQYLVRFLIYICLVIMLFKQKKKE